jgi:membrane protein
MFIKPIKSTAKLFFFAFRRMMDEDGMMVAGHIAFTGFLSLFPFLIFLAAASGFLTSAEDVPRIIDLLFEFAPSEVAEAVAPAVTEIISAKPAGLLTFGFLGTLWASSSGLEALRIALNRAYHIEKRRPLWRRRIQSIFFIILSALIIFFISTLIVFGPVAWEIIAPILHFGILQELAFDTARYSFSFIVLMGALVVLHKYLPNRQKVKKYNVYPGAAFTTIIFLIGGMAFSTFITNFGNFNVAYGSLGSVIITLIFFYLSSILFIFGAYLNAQITVKAKK